MALYGASRFTLPLILWGAGYAKTLTLGWPLLGVSTYSEEADGSDTVRGKVQAMDGWQTGLHRFLKATVLAIPGTNESQSYGARSGWDSTDGWADFLAYARQCRPIRWVPDADDPDTYLACLLVEPWRDPPAIGWAQRRQPTLVLRSLDPDVGFAGY
jgi:hypothetical protein